MASSTVQPNQPGISATLKPRRKVLGSGITGCVVTILVFILNTYVFTGDNANKKITSEVSAATTTVLSFLIAYLIPPDPNEITTVEGGTTKAAFKSN